jgi:hypothetical protein
MTEASDVKRVREMPRYAHAMKTPNMHTKDAHAESVRTHIRAQVRTTAAHDHREKHPSSLSSSSSVPSCPQAPPLRH